MEEKEIIWRRDLLEITGWSKRHCQSLSKTHKLPPPDFPAQIGHPGHGGKGHGWPLQKLLPFLSKSLQEKVLAKIRADESQALVRIPPGPVALFREDCPSLPTAQYDAETINVPRAHEHTAKERNRFGERMEILSLFRSSGSVEEAKKAISLWKANNPGSKGSLRAAYRWDELEREGGPAALLPGWSGTEHSSVPDEAYGYFKKLYLTQQCRSAQVCVDLLPMQYPDIPSSGCFLRRLGREIPPHIIYYYRRGPAAYDRKFGSCAERDYSTIAPGGIYVMDHHQVDVAVLGRDGKPMFPWVTACVDARSRKYLGWVICPQPNSDTIHLAFRRACLRFGVPKEILIDNGKDFRSQLFAGGVRRFRLRLDETAEKALIYQLGVTPHFTLPYNARSKPIERSFLTLKERFSRLLPTFRGGDVTERPEELAEMIKSGKSVPIEEFEHLYAGFVEAVFNNAPHRGNGMDGRTPNEVFGQGNVARQVDENLFSLLLLKNSRPSIVGKNGVTFFNRVYFAEPLLMLKGQPVYLRYDPDEIGRVWIYTMKDEFICQATERQLLSWHATEEDMRAVKSIQKKEKGVIRSYHQIGWDRGKEPDLLKAFIAKKAQEHGVDLREGTIHPEKPLLAGMRMENKKMMEEEIRQQRETSAALSTRLMAELDEKEKAQLEAEKIQREFTQEYLREGFPELWGEKDGRESK